MPQGIASVSENEVAICFRTGFCLKPGTWNLEPETWNLELGT